MNIITCFWCFLQNKGWNWGLSRNTGASCTVEYSHPTQWSSKADSISPFFSPCFRNFSSVRSNCQVQRGKKIWFWWPKTRDNSIMTCLWLWSILAVVHPPPWSSIIIIISAASPSKPWSWVSQPSKCCYLLPFSSAFDCVLIIMIIALGELHSYTLWGAE